MGLDVVAVGEEGAEFLHFGPFVPAVGEDGAVWFYARTADDDVIVGQGRGARWLLSARELARAIGAKEVALVSHPAVWGGLAEHDPGGSASGAAFYARVDGAGVLVRCSLATREVRVVGPGVCEVGPLGPTCDQAGAVAFRGSVDGRDGVFVVREDTVFRCDLDEVDVSVEGLPCVDDDLHVLWKSRTEPDGLPNGAHEALMVASFSATEGADFCAAPLVRRLLQGVPMGRFPCFSGRGDAFVASVGPGDAGYFRAGPGGVTKQALVAYQSVRGLLVPPHPRGNVTGATWPLVVLGTLPTGEFGMFDEVGNPWLTVGQALLGGRVTAFAANPVSINSAGKFAVRVEVVLPSGDLLHAIVSDECVRGRS